MKTNTEHTSWLTSLLTGWGIKESWAKIIAGAIVGGLAAAGFLTSCTQQQLRDAWYIGDSIYHAATGTPCVFDKVEEGK